MGRGIGQVFAYAGYDVDIIDFKPGTREMRAAVMGEIAANLGLLAGLGLLNDAQHGVMRGIRLSPARDGPCASTFLNVLSGSGAEDGSSDENSATLQMCHRI